MEMTLTSSNHYDMFSLDGELTIGSLVCVTSELQKHVRDMTAKDLVLDLTNVRFLDSSGIRLFVNVNKRMQEKNRRLFLHNPAPQVQGLIAEVNLDKVFSIISSVSEVEQRVAATVFDRYRPFSTEENGIMRIQATCPVCGSSDTAGYLIDDNGYRWHWEPQAAFPACTPDDGRAALDVFAHQPIVCLDCFFASSTIRDFHIGPENNTAFRAALPESSKLQLSKSIKKRRKMMEVGVAIGDNFFLAPRDPKAAYTAYLLADFCARSMLLDPKALASPFTVGYYNYCALKFAQTDQKPELINNCRTWLTQALNHSETMNHIERAVAYFALLVADINLGKLKEAAQIHSSFERMIENLAGAPQESSLTCPHFWRQQAMALWREEIDSKSRVLHSA